MRFLLVGIAYASFVMMGLAAGLLGVAWPSMRTAFGLTLDAVVGNGAMHALLRFDRASLTRNRGGSGERPTPRCTLVVSPINFWGIGFFLLTLALSPKGERETIPLSLRGRGLG